jgi:hypothetical protein
MSQCYWIVNTFAALEVVQNFNCRSNSPHNNYICFPSTLRDRTLRDLRDQRCSAEPLSPSHLFVNLVKLLILNKPFKLFIPHLHPSLFQHKPTRLLWGILLYLIYRKSNRLFFYDEGLSTLHSLSGSPYYPPARHHWDPNLLNRYQHAFYLPLLPSRFDIVTATPINKRRLDYLSLNRDFSNSSLNSPATVHILASRFIDAKTTILLIEIFSILGSECVYYPHPNRDKNIRLYGIPVTYCKPTKPIELHLEEIVKSNDIIIGGFTSVIPFLVDLSIRRKLPLGFLLPLVPLSPQDAQSSLLSLYQKCLDHTGIKCNTLSHPRLDQLGNLNHNLRLI